MIIKRSHVFVTGAAKRIGRLLAEACLQEGARVTLHARSSRAEIDALAKSSPTGTTHLVQFDLSDVAAIDSAVASAEEALGPVDILVNSASVFFPTPEATCTEAQWDELFDANLKGQFFLARACARSMKSRGGVILNMCDTNAGRTMKHYSPYLASKAGLIQLTKNLAKEYAPKIRVNAISPGWVLTPDGGPADQVERNVGMTLMKRTGAPEDVLRAAKFLIENDYITGFNLVVDGGRAIA